MEQIPKALSDMEIGDLCHHGRYEILRVPGGWIYTCCQDSGVGGFNISSCFVPMSVEQCPVAQVISNRVGVEIAWLRPPSHGRPPVDTMLYTRDWKYGG